MSPCWSGSGEAHWNRGSRISELEKWVLGRERVLVSGIWKV